MDANDNESGTDPDVRKYQQSRRSAKAKNWKSTERKASWNDDFTSELT
jgi:hypothetical protein